MEIGFVSRGQGMVMTETRSLERRNATLGRVTEPTRGTLIRNRDWFFVFITVFRCLALLTPLTSPVFITVDGSAKLAIRRMPLVDFSENEPG
jgi:hypothetical protein